MKSIFSFYDIDNIVLEFCNNTYQYFDREIKFKQSFYLIETSYNGTIEKSKITFEDYLFHKNNESGETVFSTLNYDDFINHFPTDIFVDYLNNEEVLKMEFNHLTNKILQSEESEAKQKMNYYDIIENIKNIINRIKHLKTVDHNTIQKLVLDNQLSKYHWLKEEISNKFSKIFLLAKNNNQLPLSEINNPHPNIFKETDTFLKFEKYISKGMDKPYNDYSYIYQKLLSLDLIYRQSYKDYVNWLESKNYIQIEDIEDFRVRNEFDRFNKNKENKTRKTKFNLIFKS